MKDATYDILVIGGGINAKRYHDRDRSGWWLLLILIPLLGPLWLIVVLGFLKGTEGENRFGPDPLQANAA